MKTLRNPFLALLLVVASPLWAGRSFNGTSDLIQIPASGAIDLNGANSMTISCWFQVASLPASEADVCGIGNYHSGSDFYLSYLISVSDAGHSNEIGVHFYQNQPLDHNIDLWCPTAISTNTWYSVVGQFTAASSPGAYLIVNGAVCASTSTANTIGNSSSSVDFCIGGWASSGGSCNTSTFAGIVGEVAIWNKALSTPSGSLEGAALALATVCPVGASARRMGFPAPVGYFPLWGASGSSTEPDLSGNNNSGALTGTSPANHPPCTP